MSEVASRLVKPRRVWVAHVPAGDEYDVGPVDVMIEQFGDDPPTVAFRRNGGSTVWGRPHKTEVRDA